MSTAQRELEELRKAREVARQQAEEERKVESEKQARLAKKNDFLSKAAMFQQKKAPTEEEKRAQFKKEAAERKFGQQLNKMLLSGPKAPMVHRAEENDVGTEEESSPTRVALFFPPPPGGPRPPPPRPPPPASTAPPPPPPPPPPPAPLAPPTSKPPPPVSKPAPPVAAPADSVSVQAVEQRQPEELLHEQVEAVAVVAEDVAPPAFTPSAEHQEGATWRGEAEVAQPSSSATAAGMFNGWVYVFENEATPYYWNMSSNATMFDVPPEYTGALYMNGEAVFPQQASEQPAAQTVETATDMIVWQEVVSDAGEVYYTSSVDGSSRMDRPAGEVFVVVQGDQGEEYWQEHWSAEGAPSYVHTHTGDILYHKPAGTTIVLQQ